MHIHGCLEPADTPQINGGPSLAQPEMVAAALCNVFLQLYVLIGVS